MKKITSIGLLFFCITACSPVDNSTFDWIDGHRYRNLSEGGYCARDGSPVFGKGLTSKINSQRVMQKKNIVFEDKNFDCSPLLDCERSLWL